MNKRRRLTGMVKSNKMDKTVIVEVTRTYQHPLYHKVVRSAKDYKAHDELGCNVGDRVVIVESRPFSKTVTWMTEKIVQVEVRQEGVASQEETIEEVEALVAEEEAVEEPSEEVAETTEELVEESAEVVEDEEESAA
jgi:small subunit ribosomal protein S17